MKKQLIRFRWLGYLLIVLYFMTAVVNWASNSNRHQVWLKNNLSELGLGFEEKYSSLVKSLPNAAQKLFIPKVTIQASMDNFLSEYNEEDPRINSLALEEFSDIEGVSQLYIYSNDGFKRAFKENFLSELLAASKKLKSLEDLEIESETLSKDNVTVLSKLKALKVLRLHVQHLPPDCFKQLQKLTNLEKLIINTSTDFDEQNLSYLEGVGKLKELYVGNYGHGCGGRFDPQASTLSRLPPIASLEKVSGSCNLEDFDTSKFPKLQSVATDIWILDNNIAEGLRSNPKLIPLLEDTFSVIYSANKEDLRLISGHTYNLSFLHPETDFSAVRWSELTNLEMLDLPDGIAVSQIMEYIPYLKNLESITVSGVRFTPTEYEEILSYGIKLKDVTVYNLVMNVSDQDYFVKAGLNLGYEKKFTNKFIELLGGSRKHTESLWTPEDINRIKDKSINSLQIKVNKLTTDIISELNQFKKLDILDITCYSECHNLNLLKQKEKIKSLSLTLQNLPSDKFDGFKHIETLILNIRENFELHNLFEFKDLLSLKELSIETADNCQIDLSGLSITSIEQLELSGGMFTMEEREKLKSLSQVYISGETDLNVLKSVCKPDLECFELSEPYNITDQSLAEIIKTKGLLKELNLRLSRLTTGSLAKLSILSNLEYLVLPDCSTSQILKLLPELKKIESVALTGLKADKDILAERFPQIEFSYR